MPENLIIKDGNGDVKSLQVDSGSYGYISNHAVVSNAVGSTVSRYYTNAGWNWQTDSGLVSVASYNSTRRSLIISNNSEVGKCYILVGSSDFGIITDISKPPPVYSFLLDSGGTYFADTTSAVLQHTIYVPSSSLIPDSSSMTVMVTQIY